MTRVNVVSNCGYGCHLGIVDNYHGVSMRMGMTKTLTARDCSLSHSGDVSLVERGLEADTDAVTASCGCFRDLLYCDGDFDS